MLDRRIGKRRLQSFDFKTESEKVIQFLKIRCECEGLPINRVAGGFSPPAPTTRSMRVRTARFT